MKDDKWLLLESKEACIKLLARLGSDGKLGVPLSLSDGQWAQCVTGKEKKLTLSERKKVVSFASFGRKLRVV